MLRQTFIHLPGVGLALEQRLWAAGVRTWDDFTEADRLPLVSAQRQARLADLIDQSRSRLDDLDYWGQRLPRSEHWRLYGRFKSRAAFLDIETSGLSVDQGGEVSLIGLFDGCSYRPFVNGYNLDRFEMALEKAGLVVTFNGACFDLPYLAAYFRHLRLPAIHLDLRYLLRRLGYQGGLKKIEPLFGLRREAEVAGLDGFQAVILWRRFLEGDRRALSLLIRYNRADTVNLMPLMDRAYQELQRELKDPGFESGQELQ
ncbi:MAG: ribonuclease H-like domain-containing protein [Deltaproteobacteria bacterium]|nr:ribonuclease H-like domain-containing protein [Deltaproteobacteria bacterium]